MEYVTHNISYADLAKKYELNVAAVNNHGMLLNPGFRGWILVSSPKAESEI